MSGHHCGPSIPEELIWEILSRLPVKTLMQFRCVCKSWNSFIFEPTFVNLHLHRSPTNTSILCKLYEPKNCQLSLQYCSLERFLDNPSSIIHETGLSFKSKYNIVGICNGLVCLETRTVESGIWKSWIRFWNPATRLRSKKSCIDSDTFYSDLIFKNMGFGYDDSRDTYKVVSVVLNKKSLETEVRVHCMGDNCWRKVINWSGFPKLESASGQYLSGTLNWIAQHDSSENHVIYSFDLRNETHRCLLVPDGLNFIQNLRVLNGCLCVFANSNDLTRFSVWKMKEFGVVESWDVLLNVRVTCCPMFNMFSRAFTLCMYEKDDVLLFLALDRRSNVVIYSLRDNRVQHLKLRAHASLLSFFDYVQTLVLPY